MREVCLQPRQDRGAVTWKVAPPILLGHLAFIDILFFPYFQWFIVPLSLPFVVVAALVYCRLSLSDLKVYSLLLVSLAVFVSVAASLFAPRLSEFAVYNVKAAFQLISTFAYYFFYRWLCRTHDFSPVRWLYFFLAWIWLLGIQFVTNPFETHATLIDLYGASTASLDEFSEDLRFRYLFADPNTAGYFILIAVGGLFALRPNASNFFVLIVTGAFFSIITQSSGVMLAFVLMVALLGLQKLLAGRFGYKTLLAGACVMAVVLVTASVREAGREAATIDAAYQRLFEDTPDRVKSGGGRSYHWKGLLEMTPLPFGRGYSLFDEGRMKPPHSDLFGTVYRYGVVAVLPLLFLIFGRIRGSALLVAVPALVTFLINTLIDDQKLLGLFLMIAAILGAQCSRTRAEGPFEISSTDEKVRLKGPEFQQCG